MSEYIVTAEDADIRLDRWFKRHQPDVQHSLLEKGLRKGDVRVEGKKATASRRLIEGEKITLSDHFAALVNGPGGTGVGMSYVKPAERPKVPDSLIKTLNDAVLYEDAELLILNKPPGLAVQGGSGQRSHVDGALPQLREGEQLKLVHRLDKDTSGVLVLAKGAKSAGKLTKLFATKTIEKLYMALVIGVPHPKEGVINLPLLKEVRGKDSAMGVAMEKVGVNLKDGQKAITDYRVLDVVGNRLSWVELRPVTGRTHQLRVHMDAIGCPIVGDGKYGGADAFVQTLGLPEKLHLHAHRIIIDKWNGKRVDVKAPLPTHMMESKRILGE